MFNMNGATSKIGLVSSSLRDLASVLADVLADVLAKKASASKALTLPLLQGGTTLTEALEEEENMLFRLAYPSQRFEFFFSILQHRKDFEAIVSYHLSLAATEICRFGELGEWKHGSFNVVYRYTSIIGASIQGEEYCLGYLCPIKQENQHILVTRTRNYAPKLPPLSGLRTIVPVSQYLTYGVLDFQAVRVYESSLRYFQNTC
jgi:hypothetical protein